MGTHEGWRNYETWSVQLIIDNDEPLYRHRQAMVAAVVDRYEEKGYGHAARETLSEQLESWVTAEWEERMGSPQGFGSLWSQLITAALSEVDWEEIANAWIDERAGEFTGGPRRKGRK